MVFENASDVKINIDSSQGAMGIVDLHRENPKLTPNKKFMQYTFRFECQEGEVSVVATGFKMFVRKNPELIERQSFKLVQRNGINFDRALSTA